MRSVRTRLALDTRLWAGWLLLISLLLPPAAPLLAAWSDPMPCCKNGSTHSCCARKSKAKGTTYRAASVCGKDCCLTPQAPPTSQAWIPSRPLELAGLDAVHLVLVSGTGQVRPVQLPDPRCQRPPPVLLFS